MSRVLHPVSAKIAIFTPDYTKVLLTEYLQACLGLPGGHLDDGETPSQAAVREISEELGITLLSSEITPQTFWKHNEGKIILGFTAVLPETTVFTLDPAEVDAVHWVSIADITSGATGTESYDDYIISCAAQFTSPA
ncbi:MAG: NUDIX hydrolase [Candidatus Saccharimonadales bacterium]